MINVPSSPTKTQAKSGTLIRREGQGLYQVSEGTGSGTLGEKRWYLWQIYVTGYNLDRFVYNVYCIVLENILI